MFNVSASFPKDPFLARQGLIGKEMRVKGSVEIAKDACARGVVAFLFRIVQEDEVWFERDQKRKEDIENFPEELLRRALVSLNLLGLDGLDGLAYVGLVSFLFS